MKLGQFFKNAALVAALACPLFTSCGLEEMRNDIADLEDRVGALEERLTTEVEALTDLINGLVTVKSVKTNDDGSVVVTLSDDKTFTVYPEAPDPYSSLVTYTEIDGVKYWAVYGEDGTPEVITDVNDEPIPVDKATPEVKEVNGLVYISFDRGETWIQTGNTLFAGAEVVYTDYYTEEEENDPDWPAQEDPMYVVITLAGGEKISLTIDGASALLFGSPHMQAYTSLYVQPGTTFTQLPIYMMNISEYIFQIPTGWFVEESYYYEELVLNITAPAKEAIVAGTAQAEAYLKVIGVCEGGKTVAAKLLLTTKPFNKLTVQKDQAVIDFNESGASQGYWYGVSPAESFDPAAVLAEVQQAMDERWRYEGPLLQDHGDLTMNLLDIDSELEYGTEYVLWAVPTFYDQSSYEEYLGELYSSNFVFINVEVEEVSASFNDIKISVNMEGVTEFWAYFQRVEYIYDMYDSAEEWAYDQAITWSWSPTLMADFVYEGPYEGDPISFTGSYEEMEPGKTYVLAILPYKGSSASAYSPGDVYVYEFSTDALQAGGSLKVETEEPVVDQTSITVPFKQNENVVYLYYAWVTSEMAPTVADKAAYLIEKGGRLDAYSYTYAAKNSNLRPETEYVLFAMAVGKDGKYGEVYEETFKTLPVEFNDVVVTITPKGDITVDGAEFELTATAEVSDYIYWVGPKDNWMWEDYFLGTAEGASEYIALHPDYYNLKHVDPAVAAVEATDLEYLKEYALVVTAVVTDENGKSTYSKATVYDFDVPYELGNFVDSSSETWEGAKPEIEVINIESREFVTIDWTVKVAEGYRVLNSCCISPEYVETYPTAKDATTYLLIGDEPTSSSYAQYVEHDVFGDPVETPYWCCHYASSDSMIYTVIADAEGNVYEYYTYDPEITSDGGFGM